jgi:hypothetical protein
MLSAMHVKLQLLNLNHIFLIINEWCFSTQFADISQNIHAHDTHTIPTTTSNFLVRVNSVKMHMHMQSIHMK